MTTTTIIAMVLMIALTTIEIIDDIEILRDSKNNFLQVLFIWEISWELFLYFEFKATCYDYESVSGNLLIVYTGI